MKRLLLLMLATVSCAKTVKNNACRTLKDYYQVDTSPNCVYKHDYVDNLPNIVYRYTGVVPEVHKLKTDDGYYLTMHRIKREKPKGVILMMHPILTDSFVYIFSGNKSMAVQLWRAGYDIWLANQRGTIQSEGHVKYTIRDYNYWNFTFHDIAYYEMPKLVELIRKHTNNAKLIYFGHSMGTGVGLAYASLFPKEAEVAFNVFVIAGVTCFFKYNVSPAMSLSKLSKLFQRLTEKCSVGFVFPLVKEFRILFPILAKQFPVLIETFMDINEVFAGPPATNPMFLGSALASIIANLSWKNLFHLFQLMEHKTRFQQYDYGLELNRQYYGTDLPPLYHLENVTVPFYPISSTNDILTSFRDTALLLDRLPEKAKKYGALKVDTLNHIDYLLGLNSSELFIQPLIKFLHTHFNKEY